MNNYLLAYFELRQCGCSPKEARQSVYGALALAGILRPTA